MEARSLCPNRPFTAAWPSAQSTRVFPATLARVTAASILARIFCVPAAAASDSQTRAPSPMARNSRSACAAGPHPVLAGLLGRRPAEVVVVDPRGAGRGPPMPGDLDRALVAVVDDDDLLVGAGAVGPDPHLLTEQVLRDGVLAVLEGHHRRVRRHPAGQPEHDRVRLVRHPVQPDPFLGEHLDRRPAGHPVHPVRSPRP